MSNKNVISIKETCQEICTFHIINTKIFRRAKSFCFNDFEVFTRIIKYTINTRFESTRNNFYVNSKIVCESAISPINLHLRLVIERIRILKLTRFQSS